MEKIIYQWPGQRIDKYLSSVFPYSRSFFEHIIARGGVLVQKTPVKKSYKLKSWEEISIDNLERYLSTEVLDEAPNIDIPVIKETTDYLVIHKPKWVLSHPNSVRDVGQPSVVWFLYHRYKDLPSVWNFVRAGLIHRLDKDTDGLMILVKTEAGLAHFKKLFQAKSESNSIEAKEAVPLKKFYRAMCWLSVEGRKFLAEIKNNLPHIIEEEVIPKVTPCVPKMGITKIMHTALSTKNTVTLELEILTGRTHQIRYHLSTYGLPIIWDKLYGPDNNQNQNTDMQLTAYRLVFEDLDGELVDLQTIESQPFEKVCICV